MGVNFEIMSRKVNFSMTNILKLAFSKVLDCKKIDQ